ncbi:hypothetical protein [Nitrospira sp. M1]
MAFGIDDASATAATGINLTDTVVRTLEAYRQNGRDIDIEQLNKDRRGLATGIFIAGSVRSAINLLRQELIRHKTALTRASLLSTDR